MPKRRSNTFRTLEAVVDRGGRVRLLEEVKLPKARRALVTLIDESGPIEASETALLSERALVKDWSRPEEDEAWSHLQSEL